MFLKYQTDTEIPKGDLTIREQSSLLIFLLVINKLRLVKLNILTFLINIKLIIFIYI